MTSIRTVLCAISVIIACLSSCQSVDDNRIPAFPVDINLSDPGLWTSYGVAGFGMCRYFVPQLKEPAGFSYTANTATGFGGVLLIGGMNAFTAETDVPLAYDLACPVECDPNIRVVVDPSSKYEAICPKCGSHYDVTMAGGNAISGPAAEGKHKYGLTRYQCLRASAGGYIIRR